MWFQHTAARRRLDPFWHGIKFKAMFQHTAARRRLVNAPPSKLSAICVSTHSRPKAAGLEEYGQARCPSAGFNTQPPEGGWHSVLIHQLQFDCFNTQPPEGGWAVSAMSAPVMAVSTHSRPKAAGNGADTTLKQASGFNTQPPEGGWKRAYAFERAFLRFNTQPPEGGWTILQFQVFLNRRFQHTAARRRLAHLTLLPFASVPVSTHSRPKAAGYAQI